MKRWNGWGDDAVTTTISPGAKAYLENFFRPCPPGPSALLENILKSVPESRLPDHPLVDKEKLVRLQHACGHSLPDWISLRFGSVKTFPDGVAFPKSEDDISELLLLAKEHSIAIIPYGGGTSVVRHINPVQGDQPVLSIDMSRMFRLIDLDKESLLATFNAGVNGPHLEAQLRNEGLTLGHFPQSFEYSTLGGWIATRSAGQQSLFFGRIEDIFAGGKVITPTGTLQLPLFPASAAGPDLRHLILGSEGRLGIITRATVRVRHLPESESFHALFFPDWLSGVAAVREIIQSGIRPSMLRLSNDLETRTTLAQAGHATLINILEKYLSIRGVHEEKCLLFFGVTGSGRTNRITRSDVLTIARSHGGVYTGKKMGSEWRKHRFLSAYVRNTLWESGYAVDTLETAMPWSHLLDTTQDILTALREGLNEIDERVLAFTHVSHFYQSGASIYVSYLFRIAPTAEETYERWFKLKDAASRVILSHGGTISHQHGVGLDHLPYLNEEKGTIGMDMLREAIRLYDPNLTMNPGKLLDID